MKLRSTLRSMVKFKSDSIEKNDRARKKKEKAYSSELNKNIENSEKKAQKRKINEDKKSDNEIII